MQKYAGIYNDNAGGLTNLGRIVMDAWVFEIIPMSETCEGWDAVQMQNLYDKVFAAWEPYGGMPGNLPDDLRMRHAMIYESATKRGQATDWDSTIDGDD
ncbi:MAG TPA: hypothetical protein VFF74_01160 [Methylophilaceae bacterium]|nr:hypothetical protein [Methylophilaceae bacterium]